MFSVVILLVFLETVLSNYSRRLNLFSIKRGSLHHDTKQVLQRWLQLSPIQVV